MVRVTTRNGNVLEAGGLVELLFAHDTLELVGVHIIGHTASEPA